MKKIYLCLMASTLVLSSVGLTSCDSNITSSSEEVERSSTIIISEGITNGRVSLSTGTNVVSLNTEVTLIVEPDRGYTTENVTLNGEILSSPYSFIATQTTYVVDANFVVDTTTYGQTKIEVDTIQRVTINESKTLDAVIYGPSNNVLYESNDETIVSVDQNGTITGNNPGFGVVSITSLYDQSISEDILVYVTPTYVSDMIDSYTGYDYENGVKFSGNVELEFEGSLFSTTGQFLIPLDLDIQNSDDFNLHLNLDFKESRDNSDSSWGKSFIYSLVYGVLFNKIFTELPVFDSDAKSLDIYLDSSLDVITTYSSYAPRDESNYLITGYTSQNIFEVLGNTVSSLGGILTPLLPTLVSLLSDDSGLDITSLTLLNSVLTYEENKISINESLMPVVNQYYEVLRDETIPGLLSGDLSDYASMISYFFPESINEIYLEFVYDENDTFSGLELVVNAQTQTIDYSTFSYVNKDYDFITISLYKEEDLSSTYFDDLYNQLNNDLSDYNQYTDLNDQIDELSALFEDDYNSSVYLAKNDTTYLTRQSELLNNYLSNDIISKFVSLPTCALPFLDYDISVNSTSLEYTVSNGNVYYQVSIGDVLEFDIDLLNLETSESANFYLTCYSSNAAVDYTNSTLTINSLPSDNEPITVTLNGTTVYNSLRACSETIYINVIE